jgi:hypothetical protein
MRFDMNLPFNFQKGEQVVWVFDEVDYLEDRTHHEYVGGSRGVSVRVMKGVYYHAGGFKGRAIDRTERVHVDTGLVAVTTKQIYFSGEKRRSEYRMQKLCRSNHLPMAWERLGTAYPPNRRSL